MKTYTLILVLSIFCISLFSQESAVSRGAFILSGTASFSSSGGDLFEDMDNNALKSITLTPSLNAFVVNNFFMGLSAEMSSESQGDYRASTTGFGPQIGYAFGDSNSEAFPFISAGINAYSMAYDYGNNNDGNITGRDIHFNFGMIVPVKSHIGIVLEGSYHMLNLTEKSLNVSGTGAIFTFAIGVVGLLF